MREKIEKWIIGSLTKWFTDNRQDIPFWVEGTVIAASVGTDYAELRMTGPQYRCFTRQHHRFTITINVLINAVKTNDTYKIYKYAGVFEKACAICIPVYKFGDNNNELFGRLEQVTNDDKLVDVTHFGVVNPTTQIIQATVESYYRLTYLGSL